MSRGRTPPRRSTSTPGGTCGPKVKGSDHERERAPSTSSWEKPSAPSGGGPRGGGLPARAQCVPCGTGTLATICNHHCRLFEGIRELYAELREYLVIRKCDWRRRLPPLIVEFLVDHELCVTAHTVAPPPTQVESEHPNAHTTKRTQQPLAATPSLPTQDRLQGSVAPFPQEVHTGVAQEEGAALRRIRSIFPLIHDILVMRDLLVCTL